MASPNLLQLQLQKSNIMNKPLISGMSSTLLEDTKMFSRFRETNKQTGDMFLLGKPSATILNLLLKLYHENIVRCLLLDEKTPPKMMLGIMELEDGRTYMAISEDPREDPDYPKKFKTLYSLLKQANVTTTFPEQDAGSGMEGVPNSLLFPDTFNNWRVNNNEKVLTKNKIDQLAPGTMFIPATEVSASAGPTTKYNYDSAIWAMPLTVNLVHSVDYLNKRRKTGVSFIPYKKVKEASSSSLVFECNNGSTCTESKLFSYLFDNLKLKFADIKGYVSYWIGDKLPPNHIIANYCFSRNSADAPNLQKLYDDTTTLLDPEIRDTLMRAYPDFENVFKSVIQPFALSCPGCVANYTSYRTNKQESWDNSFCTSFGNRVRTAPSFGGSGKSSSLFLIKHKKKSRKIGLIKKQKKIKKKTQRRRK
jgi:hypothetical protein